MDHGTVMSALSMLPTKTASQAKMGMMMSMVTGISFIWVVVCFMDSSMTFGCISISFFSL